MLKSVNFDIIQCRISLILGRAGLVSSKVSQFLGSSPPLASPSFFSSLRDKRCSISTAKPPKTPINWPILARILNVTRNKDSAQKNDETRTKDSSQKSTPIHHLTPLMTHNWPKMFTFLYPFQQNLKNSNSLKNECGPILFLCVTIMHQPLPAYAISTHLGIYIKVINNFTPLLFHRIIRL